MRGEPGPKPAPLEPGEAMKIIQTLGESGTEGQDQNDYGGPNEKHDLEDK